MWSASFDLARELLAFGADLVDELGIRGELLAQGHRPRFRIRLGVVDGDVDLDVPEVGPPYSLTNLAGAGNHAAAPVDPQIVAKPDAVDDQRVAVPGGRRITLPRGIGLLRQRAAIREDL